MDEKLEGCRHLFVVSSIPVVYVNSNLVEAAFGFLPGQQDLEDDFKDQWLSRTHKEERLRLIHRLLRFSEKSGCRVTIVSGDVHVAALGYVQSARDGFANEEPNVINQLISSAIVHPPPPGLIVYAMEQVMADNVEEVDRGITARMMRFPPLLSTSSRNVMAQSGAGQGESRLGEVVRRGQRRALHQGRPPDRREMTISKPRR